MENLKNNTDYRVSENQRIRESHIDELKRRGIEPTQENIDKLMLEIEETIKRLDRDKETIIVNKKVESLKEISWEEEREIRLDNAAYDLSDEIWPIKDKLEKVNLLMGDVLDDFFRHYDPENEKDRLHMSYQFNRYCLLADISHKLIWEAYREIETLEKRGDKLSQLKHRKLDETGVK